MKRSNTIIESKDSNVRHAKSPSVYILLLLFLQLDVVFPLSLLPIGFPCIISPMLYFSPSPVIGVFTKQLDNWTSGSGHHLNEIMHRVLDRNEQGPCFKFVFIHYAPSSNPIYKRVEELIIPRNPILAARILQKRHFDILHYTPLTIFAPIWGVRAKKVATIHGAEQLIVPQFYGFIEMLHERFLVPLYARKMDHILTVSHTSRGFFMGRYGVQGDRITVCPNAVSPLYRRLQRSKHSTGADISAYPPSPSPQSIPIPSSATVPESYSDVATLNHLDLAQAGGILNRFGLSTDEPFIFHLSRFSERKNPWTILKGFSRFLKLTPASSPLSNSETLHSSSLNFSSPMKERGAANEKGEREAIDRAAGGSIDTMSPPPSSFKLVIGGSRWDNPAVDRMLAEEGITDRVIRTGFLKEEEAVAFYNFAYAFLFPSLAEGFGMPNLEAMACGCPVITSNVFAIPEVVGNAAIVLQNPLDVDSLADAMYRAVYDQPLRKQLIQRGLERVKLFDWDESARRVLEVYEGLVKGGIKDKG